MKLHRRNLAHREEGPPPDLLTGGGADRKLVERIPSHWRPYVLFSAALLAGLLAGGYGGYAWLGPPTGAHDGGSALTARVSGPRALYLPYPPYRLTVELHNRGQRSVNVREARLKLSGYHVLLNAKEPRALRPGRIARFIFGVRPECSQSVGQTAHVRLRLRTASAKIKTLTLRAPLSGPRVLDGHAILCNRPVRRIVLNAQTREVRSKASGGELLVRLRLSAHKDDRRLSYLQLLGVDLEAPGITVRGLPAQGSPSMPFGAELRIYISDCEKARRHLDDPSVLRVALSSAKGPYLVYAHTDSDFGTALRAYAKRKCGSGE